MRSTLLQAGTSYQLVCGEVLAVALLLEGRIASAQVPGGDPANPRPENIRVEVQVVDVDQEVATALMARLLDKSKVEEVCLEIQALLGSGKARLMAWPIVIVHPGEKGLAESADEIRYVVEHNPDAPKVQEVVNGVVSEVAPEKFHTENPGFKLEVTGTVQDNGKTIELEILPTWTALRGSRKIDLEPLDGLANADGGKKQGNEPEFDTFDLKSTVRVRSGGHEFLGAYRNPGKPKQLELFLLRAELRR
jgi:hypothetical protein